MVYKKNAIKILNYDNNMVCKICEIKIYHLK